MIGTLIEQIWGYSMIATILGQMHTYLRSMSIPLLCKLVEEFGTRCEDSNSR
jgi:hypothetical protein